MLLRPTDTNRPDYARAEEDKATSRGRVGVYRDHDLVWTCRDRHSTDGAGPEHSRGNDRFISILAGRSFLLEIILAIRAALGSGRISRRLYPTLGFNSKNLNRTGAA